MVNIIIAVVLLAIVGLASAYVIKAKKSGRKCIGCPSSCRCGKNDSSCAGCPGCSSCGTD